MANIIGQLWRHEAVRFVVIGALNTLFGFSAYALLVYLGVQYHLAITISTVAGILFNFRTTGSLVFRNTSTRLLVRFAAVYGFTYLLNMGLVTLLVNMGIGEIISGALALPVIVAVTFVVQKTIVFKSKAPIFQAGGK